MAITDMKDVKKLQKRLKSALDELKYIKKCCEDAGRELEKNSFKWDSKEKNLVIQALDLNEKYSCSLTRIMELEKYEQACRRIEKQSKINCEEICERSYESCNDNDCLTIQILNIISKAKEQ